MSIQPRGLSHQTVRASSTVISRFGIVTKIITAFFSVFLCAADHGPISLVATSPRSVWTSVAEVGGRVFVGYPRIDGNAGLSLAELHADGSVAAYPGGSWNGFKPGADPANAFVSVSALQVGPGGRLWVVDGAAGYGGKPVASAQKLLVIDTKLNAVSRVYRLASALKPRSEIADVALHGSVAYVTDAGAPGLIVLDLKTGDARRVLDRDPSTTAQRPALVDGKILRGSDGKPVGINADQIDITPDGQFVYLQPLSGPLYRIPTHALDDGSLPAATLSALTEFWYNTPSVAGMTIDGDGDLYLTDLGSDAVLKLTPDRRLTLVAKDERLHWASAPCVSHGGLLVPVAQLDRSPPFNHGHDLVHWPVELVRLQVSARPAAD